jgi:DNA-3-methyladenine glycosylase II
LGRALQTVEVIQPKSTGSVFHDLMSCVIEQQIHYRSTKKTFQKLLEKAGIDIVTPQNFTALEKAGLGDLKLSERKFETIDNVLNAFQKEEPNWEQLTDQEVRKFFKEIKGIGVWTVDMLLLYTLGRKDIFPVDDYHLKKAMVALYGLDPKVRLAAEMKNIAKAWTPYSSLAVLSLLEWKKNNK